MTDDFDNKKDRIDDDADDDVMIMGIIGSLRYGDYGLRLRINMPLRMIKTT